MVVCRCSRNVLLFAFGDLFELSIGRSTSQIFCPFCVQCGIACSSDHFKVGPGSLVLT